MPYDSSTLADVQRAIDPGVPASITAAGGEFATAVDVLTQLATDVQDQVTDVIGGDSAPWSGPAADAFGSVITGFVARINGLAATYGRYQPALNPASAALQTAKDELNTLVAADTAARDAGPVQAAAVAEAVNAAARQTLTTLAAAYTTALGALSRDPNREDPDGVEESEGVDDGPEAALAGLDAADPASLDAADPAGLDPAVLAGIDADLGGLGPTAALSGLVPVDLGAGPQLALGSLDSTTFLAGLDPLPNPALVLGRGSPAPLTPIDTALTGGGLAGPAGIAGPGPGLTPASHLTTTRTPATPPAAPPTPPSTARPPFLPMMPMGAVGPAGAASSRRTMPLAGAIGRPTNDEERDQERRTSLVGDEQWDDAAGLDGAIGRERSTRPGLG